MKTTRQHQKHWEERKIDWQQSYLDGIDPVSAQPMWNHPHRNVIVGALSSFPWISLMEVGCGAGANLKKILHHFSNKQLVGIDVNKDAIEVASKNFIGGIFKVGSVEEIPASDESVDVVLSDATLIYVGPGRIRKVMRELGRVTRRKLVLCELHEESMWKRWLYRFRTGYNVYNYKELLDELGAYDVQMVKIPKNVWPGDPWARFGYVIKASIPKI